MHRLYWPDPLEQCIQLQILNIGLPIAWFWKRYPPASVIHLFEKCCRFVRRFFHIGSADRECCKVEHHPGEFGADRVLNVVLPSVDRRRAFEDREK
jgi:hypothetical protein